MQLHTLQARTKRARHKIIGRGGKRGTTAGRGTKGQKARAGHRMRPELRDIIKKIPKKRGHRFTSIQTKPLVINVESLEKNFPAGAPINKATLLAAGLISRRVATRAVKILGTGSVSKAFTLTGLQISVEAKQKIETAGGTVA